MAINELTSFVSPPISSDFDEDVWYKAEEWLGFSLPDDYKDYARVYGSGTFCDTFLMVYCPSSSFDVYREFVEYQVNARPTHDNVPFRRHPTHPGLLMWGGDENGNRLHWLTDGSPNSWPVIAESHEREYEQFGLCMTTFLAKALRNEIRPKHIWYQPFDESELNFFPTR